MRAGLLLAGASAAAGWSAAQPDMPPVLIVSEPSSPDSILLAQLRSNLSIERYLADLLEPLRNLSRSGDALTAADVAFEQRKSLVDARARSLAEVMRYDLDGDQVVTEAEGMQSQRQQTGDRYPPRLENIFNNNDLNGDGKITIAEIYAAAADNSRVYGATRLDAVLAMDPNKDGRLTVVELAALGRAAFARVDTDGNGMISATEIEASRPLRQQAMEADRRRQAESLGGRCTMKPPSAGEQIFAVGVYDAPAISPLAIGGQDGETGLIQVHIEKGTTPLYVVLASYGRMLWKFDGDVRRVAHVAVAVSSGPSTRLTPAGVTGIKADRVSFLRGDCLSTFYKADSSEATKAKGIIRRSLGRDPNGLFGSYSPHSVLLPSGSFEPADRKAPPPPARGFDPAAWNAAILFWPAGIGQASAKDVVSLASVEPYQVLPAQFGIAQLLGNGSLMRGEKGGYRIVRAIPRYPAGMTGSHAEKLAIAPGVPRPAGDPGHSCVYYEDDLPPTGSAICRR